MQIKYKEGELDAPLSHLGLPDRVANGLWDAKYRTVRDLQGITREDLLKISNFAGKTVDLIEVALAKFFENR